MSLTAINIVHLNRSVPELIAWLTFRGQVVPRLNGTRCARGLLDRISIRHLHSGGRVAGRLWTSIGHLLYKSSRAFVSSNNNLGLRS